MSETNHYPAFYDEVYSIVAQIPPGKVLSYGQIARLTGRPNNSRQVGQAMWSAPHERGLPCHRVVNSTGRTAPNWPEQRHMLEAEGIGFRPNGCVNMKIHMWTNELYDNEQKD